MAAQALPSPQARKTLLPTSPPLRASASAIQKKAVSRAGHSPPYSVWPPWTAVCHSPGRRLPDARMFSLAVAKSRCPPALDNNP